MKCEWIPYPLGEIASFIDYRGKTPPKTTSGIPLVTAKIIKNNVILEPTEFISADFYDEWMTRGIPECGNIVFTTEAPLGEVAQIKTADKLAFAQRIIIMQGKENVLDDTFLLYALQYEPNKKRIEARSSGTTVFGIKSAELKKVEIDLPNLLTQRAIADTLSALDDKIALNTKINHHLEQMAQAIFKSWFVDFEPWGGVMPEDWETCTLNDIADIKHGYAFRGEYFCDTQTDYQLLTPGNFRIGGGFQIKPKYYNGPIPKNYILAEGDLVVTMTDLSKNGDTLGFSALVPASNLYLHNQRIGFVKINGHKALKSYVYWLMRTNEYQKYIVNHASGSTVKHTSPRSILSFEIDLPPLSVQQDIVSLLSVMEDTIIRNLRMNKTLSNLRETILPRLMLGELSVADLCDAI